MTYVTHNIEWSIFVHIFIPYQPLKQHKSTHSVKIYSIKIVEKQHVSLKPKFHSSFSSQTFLKLQW